MEFLGELSPAHLVAALAAYLLGSIPFGLILTKLAGRGDVRDIGSGNVGATNVLRTGAKGAALATLVLDTAKGAAAVLAASAFETMNFGAGLAPVAALAAVLGHVFPVWLKFDGGKGVSTTLGVMLGLAWPVGLAALLVWLAVLAAGRYSSLAALVALASAPLFAWWLADPVVIWLAIFFAVLGFVRHRENIRRLLRGEESKVGR